MHVEEATEILYLYCLVPKNGEKKFVDASDINTLKFEDLNNIHKFNSYLKQNTMNQKARGRGIR
jgi:hypothetical protein